MPARQRGLRSAPRHERLRLRFEAAAGRLEAVLGRTSLASPLDEAEAQARRADALRHGDIVANARREIPTLTALVDEFLEQFGGEMWSEAA